MSKVLTFSRIFPKGHPREGQPTFFVEKLLLGFPEFEQTQPVFDTLYLEGLGNLDKLWAKKHTIRGSKRFKKGDKFSPRVWLGKPYCSKQFAIAPDIEVVRTIDFGMRLIRGRKEFYSNDCDLTYSSILQVAKNDGLDYEDFLNWFSKPFEGQIIIWNNELEY